MNINRVNCTFDVFSVGSEFTNPDKSFPSLAKAEAYIKEYYQNGGVQPLIVMIYDKSTDMYHSVKFQYRLQSKSVVQMYVES